VSPVLFVEFPSFWTTTAVFVTSIDDPVDTWTTVGSSVVLPSLSSPSSEVSDTFAVCPGLFPIAVAVLITLPEDITDCWII
jgi:hypothetical protein